MLYEMKFIKKLLAITLAAMIGVSVMNLQISQPVSAETTETKFTAEINKELSREAATEGMVLLQNNENSLPLKSGDTVAIFGSGQINFIKGGTGSGDVNVDHVTNLLEGMETKQSEGKVSINQTIANNYKANSSYIPTTTAVTAAATQSDTAVVVITRNSGEGSDRTATAGDYYLSSAELSLLNKICAAGFDNVTVVLNIGGIIDTSWIKNYPEVQSVLLAWQPGMEGGLAVADILVGDVNPSGKLTDTFAKSYDDYPSSATFNEAWDHVDYTEDIYVGYRYFETFDPNYEKVNYEFGYGLSYTTFSITNVGTSVSDGKVKTSAKVTNTGSRSGKEVVQVYFSAPQGLLGKPAKELAGFAKTDLLAPGASQTLSIEYDVTDMSSYDDTGKVQKSAYVMEAGNYKIYVGNSVKNAGQNGVRYTYNVPQTIVTEQLTEQCEPIMLEKRLLADGSYESLETYDTMDNIGQKISTEGITKIEAESLYYKHCHAAVNYNDDYSICGVETYTSDTGQNRWASYILDVEEAGNYALSLGIGNAGGKLTNSIKVYIDDIEVPNVTLNFPSTGGKWNIQDVGSVTVPLPKGKFVFKIEFTNGDNFQGVLDYFTLRKGEGTLEDTEIVHNITSSGVNKIEGEDFADCDTTVGTETISTGDAAGGTSVLGLDQSGSWSSYSLNVAEAGTYQLIFNASNGYGTDHNDSVDVLVGGIQQSGVLVNLPNTGTTDNQWFNFVDTNPVTITLPAGKTVLQFNYKNFGNLDYFTLEKTDTQKASITSFAATSATTSDEKIMLKDVYEDNSLMSNFLAQLTTTQLADLAHGHGASIPSGTGSIGGLPEYGIPSAETADGPAGLRLSKSTTAWPIATLLACTWNTALIEEVGKAAGTEAIENNVDIWLAPGMNIHRNPLCGRNFEYYSEDPLVAGKIAGAMTKGVQSKKVSVTIKHFAANNKENYRGYSDSRMSERALREIYLKGFEICVKEEQPWCIMSSYNHINGTQTDESYELLTSILRDEWGFDGMVMTDWWNDSIASHEVAAGNDIKMASGDTPNVLGAITNGTLTRAELERNVSRILQMIMKTNAMDRAVLSPKTTTISGSGVTHFKAIDYTWKYSDIGVEICKDSDGGYNPTNTYEGRWLEYYINVEKGGLYKLRARVASPGGSGKIAFSADDISLGTITNTVNTGDWQNWSTTGDIYVKLAAGMNVLKLDFLEGGFNINWFELEKVVSDTGADITLDNPSTTIKPGQTATYTVTDTGDQQTITWSVSGASSSGTTIDNNGMLTVSKDETADFLIVTVSAAQNTDNFDAIKITIDKPLALRGDLDQDSKVTVSDVIQLRKIIMSGNYTDSQLAAGDMDSDKELSVSDVVGLRKYIMSGAN